MRIDDALISIEVFEYKPLSPRNEFAETVRKTEPLWREREREGRMIMIYERKKRLRCATVRCVHVNSLTATRDPETGGLLKGSTTVASSPFSKIQAGPHKECQYLARFEIKWMYLDYFCS